MDTLTIEDGQSDNLNIKIEYSEISENMDNEDARASENAELSQQQIIQNPSYNLWTSKATSCLISNYKKYRSMVGQTNQFRSLRDMFEKISIEMKKYGFYFSPQKCENKWRVLERKYKNLVMREMLKKPGRIKHYGYWEHKRALDEIFNEKRKSFYLRDNEFASTDESPAYAIILPNNTNNNANTEHEKRNLESLPIIKNHVRKETLKVLPDNTSKQNEEKSNKNNPSFYFEEIFKEFRKQLEIAELNKEKRHIEKMALRKSQLRIQERLLKLEEQKLELEKKKILALAKSIQ